MSQLKDRLMNIPVVVPDGGCTEKVSTYNRIRISDAHYGDLNWTTRNLIVSPSQTFIDGGTVIHSNKHYIHNRVKK
jgi:hypothetical protein